MWTDRADLWNGAGDLLNSDQSQAINTLLLTKFFQQAYFSCFTCCSKTGLRLGLAGF